MECSFPTQPTIIIVTAKGGWYNLNVRNVLWLTGCDNVNDRFGVPGGLMGLSTSCEKFIAQKILFSFFVSLWGFSV